MPSDQSVTFWIDRLKSGDPAALQPLWERYFAKLVGLARKHLRTDDRRSADEEDAALSAFHSFYARVQEKKFPQLEDRNDLWRLLVVITARKAAKQVAREHRIKRGAGRVRGESFFQHSPEGDTDAGLQSVLSDEPTPAFAAEMAEGFQQLLDSLGEDALRQAALLKLEGYSDEEIAAKQQCSLRTVERRLASIRTVWSEAKNQ